MRILCGVIGCGLCLACASSDPGRQPRAESHAETPVEPDEGAGPSGDAAERYAPQAEDQPAPSDPESEVGSPSQPTPSEGPNQEQEPQAGNPVGQAPPEPAEGAGLPGFTEGEPLDDPDGEPMQLDMGSESPTVAGEPPVADSQEPSDEPTQASEVDPDIESPLQAELEPGPGEYGTRAVLAEANSEMAVAELDGKIYVLGGYPSSRETQDTVQVYDPAADSWSLAASLPTTIHHPVAVGAQGRVYSLGGQVDMGGNPDTGRSFAYDPAVDEWTEVAEMPTPRGAGSGALLAGTIYVVGGRPPAANAFEAYDVAADAWTELPPLPRDYDDRNHLIAVALEGKIYVAGGRYDGGGFSSPMTDALDVYDPATSEWTRQASMLRPRGGVNGVVAYGCIHVFGGEGSNTGEPNDVFPDHDVYDPRSDTWMAVAPLQTPVHGVTGAVFLDGLIYMPGGGTSSGGSSGTDLFQVYRPQHRCE